MERPDQVLTVEKMTQAMDGWPSCSTAASTFTRQYPANFRRTSKGAYVWSSEPMTTNAAVHAAAEPQPTKELFLRVIKHAPEGGQMLAEDIDDSEALYVVRPFDPFS
jgi:hypothetical protein